MQGAIGQIDESDRSTTVVCDASDGLVSRAMVSSRESSSGSVFVDGASNGRCGSKVGLHRATQAVDTCQQRNLRTLHRFSFPSSSQQTAELHLRGVQGHGRI